MIQERKHNVIIKKSNNSGEKQENIDEKSIVIKVRPFLGEMRYYCALMAALSGNLINDIK